MRRRVSVVLLTFTVFWLALTVVAFVLGHWIAGVVALLLTAGGAASMAYRWRNPARS
jgi:hypothetical protein